MEMMGTKMDLEPTADQSCSEPSSVKLNKDVRDDFLKRACAKLAADLFVRAVQPTPLRWP